MFVQKPLELLCIKKVEEQPAVMMKQVPEVEHERNIK